MRTVTIGLLVAGLAGVAACTPNYSPNTYAAGAVQQANKVETATVVGFRQVAISANGTVGAVTGGAAGGVLGSQSGSFGINAALGAVGGTAIGSLIGTAVEHVTGDTSGWEYIVRKPNDELLSVTQREEKPIPLGQKVLVISGAQARIVPDYSVPPEPAAPAPAPKAEEKPAAPVVKEELPPPAAPAPAATVPDPFAPVPLPAEPAPAT
jgi:outer membrane lipoprotein SlyB